MGGALDLGVARKPLEKDMMNDNALHNTRPSTSVNPRVIRRPRQPWPRVARPAAAIAACTVIVACGSNAPTSSNAADRTNPGPAQAQQDTVAFARCMRSHGVSNFPDDLNFQNVPGINASAPAFRRAQTACQPLLPVKAPPPATPSARTHAKLVRLANCLRTHGYPSIPDPRPNPPPSSGSADANRYGTLYGEGDYWIGIPNSINAHGAGFVRAAIRCGATGVG